MRGSLRALPTLARVGLSLLAIAGLVTVLVSRQRDAWTDFAAPRGLFSVTALGVGLWMLVRLALRPLHEPAPPAAVLRGALGAGLALPTALAFLLSAPFEGAPPPPLSAAGVCLGLGATLGLCVVIFLRALDRGGHGSTRVALLAATAGGLAGNLSLELHCPSHALTHLLLGHATVGLLLLVTYGAFVWLRAPRFR
jgi:hypothetical protein